MWKRAFVVSWLLAAWFLVCWMHWRRTVALTPTWSIPLQGRTVDFTGGALDPIVLKSLDAEDRLQEPMEVVTPGEVFQSKRALRQGDLVLKVDRQWGNRAVALRDGQIGLVELASDRIVPLCDAPPDRVEAWFAGASQVVLMQLGTTACAFDATTGRQLWNRPSTSLAISLDRGAEAELETFVLTIPANDGGRPLQPPRGRMLNVFTGVEPEWIREIAGVLNPVASPCGRYVLLETTSGDSIHDATTGQRLWATGDAPFRPSARCLRFTADGEELVASAVLPGAVIHVARWKSATGEVDEAPPPGARWLLSSSQRSTSRFRLSMPHKGPVETWIEWAELQLGWNQHRTREQIFAIVDSQQDRELGLVSTSVDEYPDHYPTKWFDGPAQLVVQTRQYLKYYSIPPQRDWAKLLLWCLMPTLVVAFGAAAVQQVRRQASEFTGNAEPAPLNRSAGPDLQLPLG